MIGGSSNPVVCENKTFDDFSHDERNAKRASWRVSGKVSERKRSKELKACYM